MSLTSEHDRPAEQEAGASSTEAWTPPSPAPPASGSTGAESSRQPTPSDHGPAPATPESAAIEATLTDIEQELADLSAMLAEDESAESPDSAGPPEDESQSPTMPDATDGPAESPAAAPEPSLPTASNTEALSLEADRATRPLDLSTEDGPGVKEALLTPREPHEEGTDMPQGVAAPPTRFAAVSAALLEPLGRLRKAGLDGLARLLELLDRPFDGLGDGTKQVIGAVAAATAIMAVGVWTLTIIIR